MTGLDRELAEVKNATRDDLVRRWQSAHGCPPPVGARRELLVASAGWHLQAKRLGGSSREAKRRLAREVARIREEMIPAAIAVDVRGTGERGAAAVVDTVGATGNSAAAAVVLAACERGSAASTADLCPAVVERRSLLPGARLLRDWNGKAHAVDVLDGRYLYEGTTYRSLSAIARQITGAHWSGPRFFGL